VQLGVGRGDEQFFLAEADQHRVPVDQAHDLTQTVGVVTDAIVHLEHLHRGGDTVLERTVRGTSRGGRPMGAHLLSMAPSQPRLRRPSGQIVPSVAPDGVLAREPDDGVRHDDDDREPAKHSLRVGEHRPRHGDEPAECTRQGEQQDSTDHAGEKQSGEQPAERTEQHDEAGHGGEPDEQASTALLEAGPGG